MTTARPATTAPRSRRDIARTAWRSRLTTVLVAVAAAGAVWLVAVLLLGVDLVAPASSGPEGLEEVPLTAVVLFGLLAGVAGWAFLVVLEVLTRRARTVWTVVAVLVLLLSFAPLLDPDLPTASRLTLGLLHLAVGLSLILGLRRRPDAG